MRFILERRGYDDPERIDADEWEIYTAGALVFYTIGATGMRRDIYACTDWKSVQDEVTKESDV